MAYIKGVANEDNDIKEREKFYNEDTIPMKYRVKPSDYNGFGKDWNRGHFIVADADFDYDEKALIQSLYNGKYSSTKCNSKSKDLDKK